MHPGFELANKYRFRKAVGTPGGQGVVWLADHLRPGQGDEKEVAVKFLHTPGHVTAEVRFRREAETMIGLASCSHIAKVHEVIAYNGRNFMVMRYYPAGSLAECLKGPPLSIFRAVEICRQIAVGLSAAHAQAKVHRDVKPANILCESSAKGAESWVLSDFGIVRYVAGPGITSAQSHPGTPVYMSPEQHRGDDATPSSDQFSLGVTLYEMLTGRLYVYASVRPKPPSVHRPEVPAQLDEIVTRTLKLDPKERFPSCHEFADALRRVQRLLAPAVGVSRRTAAAAALGVGAVGGLIVTRQSVTAPAGPGTVTQKSTPKREVQTPPPVKKKEVTQKRPPVQPTWMIAALMSDREVAEIAVSTDPAQIGAFRIGLSVDHVLAPVSVKLRIGELPNFANPYEADVVLQPGLREDITFPYPLVRGCKGLRVELRKQGETALVAQRDIPVRVGVR